ncbi:AraC family transcriptional regulator [Rheinheimera sp.]|uniref:helix-turn-helix domain-containing protein n=1 Tax=Rheinheimera sp. TaxID=1869214 RepID=UPI00307DE857
MIQWLYQPLQLHTVSLMLLALLLLCLMLFAVLWSLWRHNREALAWFGALSSVCAVLALFYLVQYEKPEWRQQLYTLVSLQMWLGPLLYFFTLKMVKPEQALPRFWGWHLLPALALALLWWLQWPLAQTDPSLWSCMEDSSCSQSYADRWLHRLSAWLSIGTYSGLSLQQLHEHHQRLKQQHSALEHIQLQWLRLLCQVFIAAVLLSFGSELLVLAGFPLYISGAGIQAFAPLVSLFMLSYFGLRQLPLQLGTAQQANSSGTAQRAPMPLQGQDRKYQTSSLTKAAAEQLWQQLLELMQSQKPYLEAGLKIAELAQQLEQTPHHVSETINGHAGLSFYDFINNYRVDEAARLLLNRKYDHWSVTDVGFQSGFNSNSTFFAQFKKRLKQTPKQFREQRQQGTASYDFAKPEDQQWSQS